jgi:hypothetical protein
MRKNIRPTQPDASFARRIPPLSCKKGKECNAAIIEMRDSLMPLWSGFGFLDLE